MQKIAGDRALPGLLSEGTGSATQPAPSAPAENAAVAAPVENGFDVPAPAPVRNVQGIQQEAALQPVRGAFPKGAGLRASPAAHSPQRAQLQAGGGPDADLVEHSGVVAELLAQAEKVGAPPASRQCAENDVESLVVVMAGLDAAFAAGKSPQPPARKYYNWGRALLRVGLAQQDVYHLIATGELTLGAQRVLDKGRAAGEWTHLNASRALCHAAAAAEAARGNVSGHDLWTATGRDLAWGSSTARIESAKASAAKAGDSLARADRLAADLASQRADGSLTPAAAERTQRQIDRQRASAEQQREGAKEALFAEKRHLVDLGAAPAAARVCDEVARMQLADGLRRGPRIDGALPTELGDEPFGGAGGKGQVPGAVVLLHEAEGLDPALLQDADHLSLRASTHRARKQHLMGRNQAGYLRELNQERRAVDDAVTVLDAQRAADGLDLTGVMLLGELARTSAAISSEVNVAHAAALLAQAEVEERRAALAGLTVQRDGELTTTSHSVLGVEVRVPGGVPSLAQQIALAEDQRARQEGELASLEDDEAHRSPTLIEGISLAEATVARLHATGVELDTQITQAEAALAQAQAEAAGADAAWSLTLSSLEAPDFAGKTRPAASIASIDANVAAMESAYGVAAEAYAHASRALTTTDERAELVRDFAAFSFEAAAGYADAVEHQRMAAPQGAGASLEPPPTQERRLLERADRALADGEKARRGLQNDPALRAALGLSVHEVEADLRELQMSSVIAHADVAGVTLMIDSQRAEAQYRCARSIIQGEMREVDARPVDLSRANEATYYLAQSVSDAQTRLAGRVGGGVRWENDAPAPDHTAIGAFYRLERELADDVIVPGAEQRAFAASGLRWDSLEDRAAIAQRFANVARQTQLQSTLATKEGYLERVAQLFGGLGSALNEGQRASLHQLDRVGDDMLTSNNQRVGFVMWAASLGNLNKLENQRVDNVEKAYAAIVTGQTLEATVGLAVLANAYAEAKGPPDRRWELLGSLQLAALDGDELLALGLDAAQATRLRKSAAASVHELTTAATVELGDRARRTNTLADGTALTPAQILLAERQVRSGEVSHRYTMVSEIGPLDAWLHMPGADPLALLGPISADGERLLHPITLAANDVVLGAMSEQAGAYAESSRRLALAQTFLLDVPMALLPVPGTRLRVVAALRGTRLFKAAQASRAGRAMAGVGHAVGSTGRAIAQSRAVVGATVLGARGAALVGSSRAGVALASAAASAPRAVGAAKAMGRTAVEMAAVSGVAEAATALTASLYGEGHKATQAVAFFGNWLYFSKVLDVVGPTSLGSLGSQLALGESLAVANAVVIPSLVSDPRSQYWAAFALGVFVPSAMVGASHVSTPKAQAMAIAEGVLPELSSSSSPSERHLHARAQRELSRELTDFFASSAQETSTPGTATQIQRQNERLEWILDQHQVPEPARRQLVESHFTAWAWDVAVANGGIELQQITPEQAIGLVDEVASVLIDRGVDRMSAYHLAGQRVLHTLGATAANLAQPGQGPDAFPVLMAAMQAASNHAAASRAIESAVTQQMTREASPDSAGMAPESNPYAPSESIPYGMEGGATMVPQLGALKIQRSADGHAYLEEWHGRLQLEDNLVLAERDGKSALVRIESDGTATFVGDGLARFPDGGEVVVFNNLRFVRLLHQASRGTDVFVAMSPEPHTLEVFTIIRQPGEVPRAEPYRELGTFSLDHSSASARRSLIYHNGTVYEVAIAPESREALAQRVLSQADKLGPNAATREWVQMMIKDGHVVGRRARPIYESLAAVLNDPTVGPLPLTDRRRRRAALMDEIRDGGGPMLHRALGSEGLDGAQIMRRLEGAAGYASIDDCPFIFAVASDIGIPSALRPRIASKMSGDAARMEIFVRQSDGSLIQASTTAIAEHFQRAVGDAPTTHWHSLQRPARVALEPAPTGSGRVLRAWAADGTEHRIAVDERPTVRGDAFLVQGREAALLHYPTDAQLIRWYSELPMVAVREAKRISFGNSPRGALGAYRVTEGRVIYYPREDWNGPLESEATAHEVAGHGMDGDDLNHHRLLFEARVLDGRLLGTWRATEWDYGNTSLSESFAVGVQEYVATPTKLREKNPHFAKLLDAVFSVEGHLAPEYYRALLATALPILLATVARTEEVNDE